MRFDFVTVAVFSTPLFFQPLRPSATSPIFCCTKHPVMLRGTAEEEMYFPFASAPILYVIPCNVTGHGRGGGGEVSNVN